MNRYSRLISVFTVLGGLACAGVLRAREEAETEPVYSPGLLQCFSTADEETTTDCRPARLVALHLPANTAPSPFTGQGPTTVEGGGFLDIDVADDFTFPSEGRGRFTLTLGGKEIFDSSGDDLSREKAVTVELDSGKIPLLAVYTAAPAGARELRLFWSSFDWQREPVPPTVLFHDPADKAARESAALRQGRELFAGLHCVKCHPGVNISKTWMPELSRDAPSLLAAGRKFRQD